jgi:hypothetical protein
MFIECAENCPTGKKCSNRRFQARTPDYTNTLKVQPYPGRGFGIQATKFIPRDAFVMEYRGEIINEETSMKRMNTIYKFSKHHYFLNYGYNEVIDGHRKGTIARFANHSCDPNCKIEKWKVDGEYRFGIVACKNIYAGDELTYDYRFQSFGKMQKCSCGAENCRGFIGAKRDTGSSPAITAEAARKLKLEAKKAASGASRLSRGTKLVTESVVLKSNELSDRARRANNRRVYANEESMASQTAHDDVFDNDGVFLMTLRGSLVPNEKFDGWNAKQMILNWKELSAKPFTRRNLIASKRVPDLTSNRNPLPKRNMEDILSFLEATALDKDKENGIKTRRTSRK